MSCSCHVKAKANFKSRVKALRLSSRKAEVLDSSRAAVATRFNFTEHYPVAAFKLNPEFNQIPEYHDFLGHVLSGSGDSSSWTPRCR